MVIQYRYLTVTQGNLNNHHLYLTKVMDLFPEDVIGGHDKAHSAPRIVRVEWGSEAVETDIVAEKRIFRKRGWVREFFDANYLRPGEKVLLEQLDPYVYRVSRAAQVNLVA